MKIKFQLGFNKMVGVDTTSNEGEVNAVGGPHIYSISQTLSAVFLLFPM